MHNDNYYRSRIPLPLVLLFLVNIFIVCALEILLLYRAPLPLTAETLAEFDDSYENCSILQTHQRGHLYCLLAETESGEIRLIPVKAHSILFTRGRIYEKQIVTIPEDVQETAYEIRIGLRTATVTVSPEPLPYTETQEPSELYMAISYSGSMDAATFYMIVGAALEAAELALWHILKHQ